jgi:hypothetical protein
MLCRRFRGEWRSEVALTAILCYSFEVELYKKGKDLMAHCLRGLRRSMMVLFLLAASLILAICGALPSPSRSQPATTQPTPASPNQTSGPGSSLQPSQVPPPQSANQVSQGNVPLADLMQYEKFLTEQTTTLQNLTKQQLDFMKVEMTKQSEQTSAITTFLERETTEFKVFVQGIITGGLFLITLIAGVVGFLGGAVSSPKCNSAA